MIDIGGPSDCIYIVAVGRLRAEDPDGKLRGEIGRLECVGEVGLLANRPRSALVYAIRDSYLLRIGRDDLIELLLHHPEALLRMTQIVIQRLQLPQRPSGVAEAQRPRCMALVPATPSIDIEAFARQLQLQMSDCGSTQIVDAAGVDEALGAGFAQMTRHGAIEDILVRFLHAGESAHRHLLYLADSEPSAWSLRCMRQSDRVLVVADARDPPASSPMLDELRRLALRVPIELVLLRAESAPAGAVMQWRQLATARTHYFLRLGDTRDAAFLARSLTGRALGVVLGGGGARGFAHIGLIRALQELQMPVDALGGTSMGAFLSALAACGFDWQQIRDIAHETFVKRRLLNDYLLPRVALIRGRKFYGKLKEIFGDRQIEQLRTPYYCVSANLTRGAPVVHDRGPLAMWVATSMAIPGVAPPVVWNGDLLVDGAVVNGLPTDVMQALERGPILGSDVSTEGALTMPGIDGPDPDAVLHWAPLTPGAGKRPSLISILFRTATLTSESGTAARAARADTYLRLPVSGVGLFEWKRLDEVAERAYEFAMQKLPDLQSRLLSCELPPLRNSP